VSVQPRGSNDFLLTEFTEFTNRLPFHLLGSPEVAIAALHLKQCNHVTRHTRRLPGRCSLERVQEDTNGSEGSHQGTEWISLVRREVHCRLAVGHEVSEPHA